MQRHLDETYNLIRNKYVVYVTWVNVVYCFEISITKIRILLISIVEVPSFLIRAL